MSRRAAAAALTAALLLAPQAGVAQEAEAADHPADPWFALDHVLDVAIEMAPADWERLRHQTRRGANEKAGADCRAQPYAEVFSWFAADVTVDGRRYGNVGVRKKGFYGSLSREKPALKLGFDKLVDDQALGGVLKRTTLNNSVQDPSLLNTCLAYHVFAAAGLPAPRCNYARVAVNGEHLGLYAHVEDIERSLLQRAFAAAGGNLYEVTYGDFRPDLRGTIEKKNNRDAGDRSDVDAIVAALQDPSPAGLRALAAAVDLDRFLTFWAAEVLVGHRVGYANSLANAWFYREPGGRAVFIPWDPDNTFDTELAPALMVNGAIAHRLYGAPEWRARYAARLRQLLDTVWNETELVRRSERMAAIVQAHSLPERRAEAARGAGRVRRFIRERRAGLLAALEPEPRGWWAAPPAPEQCWGEPTSFELRFETTWGGEGTVTRYLLDGTEQALGPSGAAAGFAGPAEAALTGRENRGVISLTMLGADSVVYGVTVWLSPDRFAHGVREVINPASRWWGRPRGAILWSMRPGADEPEHIVRVFGSATLELRAAGAEPGAAVSGRLSVVRFGLADPAAIDCGQRPLSPVGERRARMAAGNERLLSSCWRPEFPSAAGPAAASRSPSLIINEVAARGEPRDWFELYNASGAPLALADFLLADDLTDRSRRFPFQPDLRIEPGAYLRVELDSDLWPGFALGRDEELGIWTWYGRPVAQVDWQEGDSGRGMSYARVPDLTGPFRSVSGPTPGAPNAGE